MYLKAYLRPCPGYGWTGGGEFQTRIVEMSNGRERRNANWSQPRHRYNTPFNNISKVAYREIKSMHMVARGQLHAFLFRDELDYEADDELFGVGDGVTTEYPLSKLSVQDGVPYQRLVHALYAPEDDGSAQQVTPVITANGVPTVAFAVDYERGVVVFTPAPGNGVVLRWSGVFSMWVRFAQDYLPFSLDNPNATNGSVDLLEVPEPDEVST